MVDTQEVLRSCLQLSDKDTRLAVHLKDNMTPSTLRSIIMTADSMPGVEPGTISDEAFIALVISVHGLQPQALRALFKLPPIIPDAALDTNLADFPIRVHTMMTWANSVEHVRSQPQLQQPCVCGKLHHTKCASCMLEL